MRSSFFLCTGAILLSISQAGESLEGWSSERQRSLPAFHDNMYAQLLVRAVTGSLHQSSGVAWSPEAGFSRDEAYARREGNDWPTQGHTMVGWRGLEIIYEALRVCWAEDIAGDFVELGVSRGGASIFAAGVIKQLTYNRSVWVCDTFGDIESKPGNGDLSTAVGLETVRQIFRNYGLLDSNVHFVKGRFAQFLPQSHIKRIAILRLGADLNSSTSDILYNMYEQVSVGGFIIIDDWLGGVPPRQKAVLDFCASHGITDEMIENESDAIFWRKVARVAVGTHVLENRIHHGEAADHGASSAIPKIFAPGSVGSGPGGWTPPECLCDQRCTCSFLKGIGLTSDKAETSNGLYGSDWGTLDRVVDTGEWKERIMPHVADFATGILHASGEGGRPALPAQPLDFPVFIVSDPKQGERRSKTEANLRSAGFLNVHFIPFIAAWEVDISDMLHRGQITQNCLNAMANVSWVGPHLDHMRRVVSLAINHARGLRMGLETRAGVFGVFEDDLMLGAAPAVVGGRITAALSELPRTADVLYLEYCLELCSKLSLLSEFKHIIRAFRPLCTAAMLFTRQGAEKALRMIETVFMTLDNMYSELIFHQHLEAYLMAPPILFQDGYFGSSKFGDRSRSQRTHRPYSIFCQEQGSDRDLVVLQILPPDLLQSESESLHIGDNLLSTTITVVSSDTLEPFSWRGRVDRMRLRGEMSNLSLIYYADLKDDTTNESNQVLIGSTSWEKHGYPVSLTFNHWYRSSCWPSFDCWIDVLLADEDGTLLDNHGMSLRPEMVYQGRGFEAFFERFKHQVEHASEP